HVQISPPQKSAPGSEWWYRYQPVDYQKIEGPLGGETELRALFAASAARKIGVLTDTVLNHMANADDNPNLQYPQFSKNHFHFPDARPCIKDWNNRFEVTHFWFCGGRRFGISAQSAARGGLPDLDTSSAHVRDVHLQYLRKLIAMGATGFRFDAAKHIERPYFEFLRQQGGFGLWSYGEVISGNPAELGEYLPLMSLTDYSLLGSLIGAVSSHGDLRTLPRIMKAALPPERALVFARTHDTAMHPGFFNFQNDAYMALAGAYLLAASPATPLLYRDDLSVPALRAALVFRRLMGARAVKEPGGQVYCEKCVSPDLHFVERGTEGWAVFNKGPAWFHEEQVFVESLPAGEWRELTYGFKMQVARDGQGRKMISAWGKPGERGLHIGPRTVLFFVRDQGVKTRPSVTRTAGS
ncbi:MAG TPA: alpha-amylase family glycosyl hydrolase, partial [Bdellovibrionales bacterium]|nr:alpha-amylase family glycosyl hydrolase [Bdellovibrionales bacterium]